MSKDRQSGTNLSKVLHLHIKWTVRFSATPYVNQTIISYWRFPPKCQKRCHFGKDDEMIAQMERKREWAPGLVWDFFSVKTIIWGNCWCSCHSIRWSIWKSANRNESSRFLRKHKWECVSEAGAAGYEVVSCGFFINTREGLIFSSVFFPSLSLFFLHKMPVNVLLKRIPVSF